jgi:hypothetical protein
MFELDGRCLVEATLSFPRYLIQDIYGLVLVPYRA